jgi:ubiquinone/menaquinone biosynthesis C-methylase UbiE
LRTVDGVPVLVGDCQRLPFCAAAFDVVFVNSVLHHLVIDQALAEISRVLRPRGLLCFVEPRPGWARRVADLITLSWLGGILPSDELHHRRVALQLEMKEYSRWLNQYSSLEAILKAHGFARVRQRKTMFSILAGYRLASAEPHSNERD